MIYFLDNVYVCMNMNMSHRYNIAILVFNYGLTGWGDEGELYLGYYYYI